MTRRPSVETAPGRRAGDRSRRLAAALPLILAVIATGGCRIGHFIGAAHSTRIDLPEAWRQVTLLLYMSADNELESQAIASLNELESVDLGGSGISVLALIDRSPGYDTSNGDWTGTRLYEIAHDRQEGNLDIVSPRLASKELGLTATGEEELDMGDPETVRHFLAFARAHYPADHLMLVIWGHASGWRSAGDTSSPVGLSVPVASGAEATASYRAAAFDDTSPANPLYTEELGAALDGAGLDVIGFDTCSEAMVEVAYELRNGVAFLVASEDVIASTGWSYREVLKRLCEAERDPEALAAALVDAFSVTAGQTAGSTISAVRLSAVGALMAELNAFSDSLSSSIDDAAVQSSVRRTLFQEVEAFYATPGDLNLDVADMARTIGGHYPSMTEPSSRLAAAAAAAVAREWHHPNAHPGARGIAVHYVPLAADGSAVRHSDAYFRNLPVEYPLSFVADSTWVPKYPAGPGLLYRIWYEVF